MSVPSMAGVVGSLGLVVVLLLVTLRWLKRLAPGLSGDDQTVALRVVQRIRLGARQGIAIVRIGEQYVAVSVGDGGVRRLTDVAIAPMEVSGVPARTNAASKFGGILQQALRGAGIAALCCLMAGTVAAQAAPVTRDSASPGAPVATRTTAKAAPRADSAVSAKVAAPSQAARPLPVARVDSMASRLSPQLQLSLGAEKSGGLKLSGTVGIVVMMGLLTLLPALVLMMTGFTRIFIVLQFLRQAIGAQSAPPTQLIGGLSLLLTLFVMAPTIDEMNATAITPWMEGRTSQGQMLADASKPLRGFMLRQTRPADIETFMRLSRATPVATPDDVPLVVLMSAFVTSELRVSFQIGFALFLPFIVIDIVVASVLMSMGMMMVPPAMISLPFKLLLFVLVDGWSLVIQGLVRSFA